MMLPELQVSYEESRSMCHQSENPVEFKPQGPHQPEHPLCSSKSDVRNMSSKMLLSPHNAFVHYIVALHALSCPGQLSVLPIGLLLGWLPAGGFNDRHVVLAQTIDVLV